MQFAGSAHLVELAPKLAHACADHPPVRLDLRFAWAPQEAEAAALPLQVRPAAHEPALLIVEMRQLHLQPTFRGRGALAEYLQDQPRPVDDLALELLFQVALLDGGERPVDDHQLGLFLLAFGGDALDLALAEQGPRADVTNGKHEGLGDHYADRLRQTLGLFEPSVRILRLAPRSDVGTDDQRSRAAGDFAFDVVAGCQALSPSSSSRSVVRSTGAAGWIVETACLYASWTKPSRSRSMQNRS